MTDPFRERLATALAATYRLGDELVGGGMSRVFSATEQALGRKVVIKVLPPELSAGVNRERFQREIQVAAQLQHPHIVPLLSAGRIPSEDATAEGELLYYTMPFIEGESLRAAIATRGRLPVREVVRILHDVIEALAYAHGRGVVHRDIKPGNILTIGSHALVTDFGVAKALSAAMPVSGMTSGGMAIGTPAYMAPEQLAADPAADHRIDIYAVGLLAYELLSGQSPFVGTSPQATMAAQLTRVPDPLDRVRDDVPPALAAIIMRCLEKLPENRPQSANALLDELDGALTPAGGTGASSAVTVTAPATTRTGGSQKRALIAGAMLIVLAGAAVALGTWRRSTAGGGTNVTVAPPIGSGSSGGAAAGTGTASASTPGAAAAAPARTSGDTAARLPIVLTRAESLAIADAIRKRVTARRDSQLPTDERALADSLSRRFERALSDSLQRIMSTLRGDRRMELRGIDPKDIERFRELARMAQTMPNNSPPVPGVGAPSTGRSAPSPNPVYKIVTPEAPAAPVALPAPGVRRVLFGAPRPTAMRRELAPIALAIADTIRRSIGARPGYDVVDAGTLTDSRFYANRSRTALAKTVGAGAVLTGLYFPRGDSLVVLQLQVFDVPRNRILRVLESKPFDIRDPMPAVGGLVTAAASALDDVDWKSVSLDSLGAKKPALPIKP